MKKFLILTIMSAVVFAFQPDITPVQVQDDHPAVTTIHQPESVNMQSIQVHPMVIMYAFQESTGPEFTTAADHAPVGTGPVDLSKSSRPVQIEKGWNKLLMC